MIINLVLVAKFFYIIFDVICMSLFGAGQTNRVLLGPILDYFGIVEMNDRGMIHLHYCV